MAGLTVGLTLLGLSAVGASVYNIRNKDTTNDDFIYLPDGSKVSPGAVVKLRTDAVSKYPEKGLTKPGSTFTGTVQYIDRDKRPIMIQVTNIVRARRFEDSYNPNDFMLIRPSNREDVGGVRIKNGMANIGTRVRYQKVSGSENSSPKSLANPFYNSVGTVESIDASTKKIIVKAIGVKDPKITYSQEYDPTELVFVSLPYEDDIKGIPNNYGFINVGTRVALTLEKYNTYQKDSGGGKSTERFLASDKFEKIGVVQAVLFGNDGKHKAVVKCKHKDSTHYYDQEYDTDDLQVVGSDGVPIGTVFVLGGIAESGVKVKLREETKEASAGKCLSRPTYGFTGTVEDIDPNADDNLKVQVRCVGSKDGEEASDWYEPEHLEVADMPTDQGVPIFGGFANVGSVVEVMVSARGVKCLGKPSVGDIGVVMGIDPNASEGETLNIKCGRDIRINTKVTNWYKPTDVKIYSKPDMSGTDEERKEVEIIKKRSELFSVQRSKPKSEAEILKRTDDIARITKEIETLEKDVEDMRKKGTSIEGMRQLYNRLMEELVKFRRTTSVIDNDYNTAKLDTTCNISDVSTEDILRKEGDAIIQRYYLIDDNDTFDDVYSIVPVAGPPRVDINFVSDAAPPDPAQLKRLEDNAKQALDDYNADTADPLRKVIADTAVTALSDFKKQRKYQGPQTDSQRNYIKKRDELIKLFKTAAATPAGAARTVNLARTYNFIIAGAAGNYFQGAADKYSAYLDVVKEVELLRNKNDIDNPIAEANRIITAKGGAQPFADEVAFLTAMAAINNVATSQPLVTAAAGSPNETVKTAGLMLEAAAASADPVQAATSLKESARQRLENILTNTRTAVTALPASPEKVDADNKLGAAITAIVPAALGAAAVAAAPGAPATQSGAELAIIAIEAAIKSLKTLNEARFSRDIESINKAGRELLAAYSSNRVALAGPELLKAQAKCNLAAYDLYVANIESASGIVDLFLTKLYWEREYRNSQAKEDYEGDFRRNFDETDVILQKLNESRKSFSTALESAANAAIPTVSLFKKLTTAFDEFDLSRRSIFDEVHGEVTDLEKRIKIMIGLKKQAGQAAFCGFCADLGFQL
jgi:hypothetical protein